LELWEPLEGVEDLRERIGALLEERRTGLGRQPSAKDAYAFLKAREDCKGVTVKLVREWILANWGPGRQGRRKVEPRSPAG
jgi:hypothetical protein